MAKRLTPARWSIAFVSLSANLSGATYRSRKRRFATASRRAAVSSRLFEELRAPAAIPIGLQLRNLIAHQRDQRRDDNGQSVPQKRGQLIAERLAAARRHHGEHVSPFEDRADNIILARPEIREPKGLPQAFPRRVQIAHARDLHNLTPSWKGRRNARASASPPCTDYCSPFQPI